MKQAMVDVKSSPPDSTTVVPYRERTTCRLCGWGGLTKVFSLPSTPLANEFVGAPVEQGIVPLVVMLCGHCGHAQLKHVVDPKRLFSNYAYASGTSAVFREHFSRYAESVIERLHLQPNDFVLEIGSNDGTLLAEFQKHGMRVLGVEPALNLTRLALEKDIPTVNQFFTEVVAKTLLDNYGPPKVVIANNVFAHIDEWVSTLRAVRKLLTESKGALVFEVQYVGDLLAKGLCDLVYHEHLDYHALTPLVKYFDTTALNITHVDQVPTHGGSLRVTAQMGGRFKGDESVVALLTAEQVAQLNTSAPWEQLQRSVELSKHRLTDALSAVFTENPDATVVGFGAPAKATTLLYAMGLKRTDLDYIVDDSPLKQGLFTPGMHIPVYPASRLLEEPPSHVIVLAWNFAESIIAKWQPLLPKTQFLVPFGERCSYEFHENLLRWICTVSKSGTSAQSE